MDPDYVADLEGEVLALRGRVAQLEGELHQVRADLAVALERKVEEMDVDIPKEEIVVHNSVPKKEASVFPVALRVVEHKELKPIRPKPKRNSMTPPRREVRKPYAQGGDDMIIITDSEEDYPHTQEPAPSKRKVKDDPKSLRPTKRQTVWVEVPPRLKRVAFVSTKQGPPRTDQAINVEASASFVKQELEQEESDALSAIRNTTLKPDKKLLDNVSVFTRLSRVGLEIFPIAIEDEIKQFSVSRLDFLSPHFGGNAVQSHPLLSEKNLQKHGFDNFMYAKLSLHPHAPSFPGAPGLWMCTCGPCVGTMEDVRLLVRIKTKPQALWQYMGQYDLCPSDPFSTQEWAMQSDQTKGEWVDHIKKDDWGSSVRARVKLRRIMGREPMKEEIPKKLNTGDVTTTEIREAFDRGDEHLYTWTLKCRGYDERFQMEIWTEGSPEKVKKAKAERAQDKKAQTEKAQAKKAQTEKAQAKKPKKRNGQKKASSAQVKEEGWDGVRWSQEGEDSW